MLELFCGTKSVGSVFEKYNYDIVSLDFNPKFNATITEDILTWDYKIYPRFYFDVIWASPDCTTFSLASGGRYRTKEHIYGLNNEHQERTMAANNMINRIIEILDYFQPNYWYIENPRGLLAHYPPFVNFIDEMAANRTLVYYANYNNWGFPKPTHIWSNLPLWQDENIPTFSEDKYIVRLNNHTGKMKRYYNSFSFKTAEERSKIPNDLIERLRLLIPDEIDTHL